MQEGRLENEQEVVKEHNAWKVQEGDAELVDMDTGYGSEDCWSTNEERRARRNPRLQPRQEEEQQHWITHLPPSLETLSISSSKPVTFSSLPSTLREITLDSNDISILDKKFPSSLRVINFSGISIPSFVSFSFFLPSANNYCRKEKPIRFVRVGDAREPGVS